MDRSPPNLPLRPRRLAVTLIAVTSIALCAAAAARAAIVFPAPGTMAVSNVPHRLHAGRMLTLREEAPLAVFDGGVLLERQLPGGGWQTMTSAPIRPRVVWLHWRVPHALGGSQIGLRFVLEARGHTLAVSPGYMVTVTGASHGRMGR